MKPSDFKIGQELCFVISRNYVSGRTEQETHIVKAIGRKWVTAGPATGGDWQNQRFDPSQESFWADGKGYTSPGAYYLTPQHYADEMELARLVGELRGRVSGYGSLRGLTLDQARRIIAILNEGKA